MLTETENTTTTDLELVFLEDTFAENVKCQARHASPETKICSVEVVARYVTGCGVDKLVCQTVASYVEYCHHPLTPISLCDACWTDVRTDWKVIPV